MVGDLNSQLSPFVIEPTDILSKVARSQAPRRKSLVTHMEECLSFYVESRQPLETSVQSNRGRTPTGRRMVSLSLLK